MSHPAFQFNLKDGKTVDTFLILYEVLPSIPDVLGTTIIITDILCKAFSSVATMVSCTG
ncbi:hypothetical protein D3C74_239310 [compost metagenome]